MREHHEGACKSAGSRAGLSSVRWTPGSACLRPCPDLHINGSLAQRCALAPAALRMQSCHVTPRDSTHGIYRVHVRRNSICREPVTGCMSGPRPEPS